MKKFLLMLMSVLMALFMCFSFVACNNDDNSDNGDETDTGTTAEEVTKNITKAMGNLYTVDGYTGEIKIDATVRTDEQASESVELSLEKRGDRVKVTVPVFGASEEMGPPSGVQTSAAQSVEAKTQSYILDIKTGYAYMEADDSYVVMQAIPANTVDYALAVIKANFGGDNGFKFGGEYNEETKTATDTLDLASYVNKVVQPVYDTYKTGSMLDLIDKYLDSFMGTNFDGLAEKFVGYVAYSKDMSAKTLIDFINDTYGYDINEALKELEFTEAQLESLKNRTVGEVAVGVCNFVDEMLESMTSPSSVALLDDEDIGSAAGGGMEQLAMGLAQAAFFDKIDDKWYTVKDGKKVIDEAKLKVALNEHVVLAKAGLGTIKVKAIVDMAAAENEYVDFMLKNEILINELKFDYSITFDEDNNIAKLELNAIFSHNLAESKVNAATPDVFANNGYGYKVTAYFNNYTDNAGSFDVTLEEGDYAFADAIVYDLTKNVTVYVENNLEAFPATPITAHLVSIEYMPIKALTVAEGDIVVDAAKGTVTVKASFMKAAFEDKDAEVGSMIRIGLGEDDDEIVVRIINMPTDQDGIIDYLMLVYEMAGSMGGLPFVA